MNQNESVIAQFFVFNSIFFYLWGPTGSKGLRPVKMLQFHILFKFFIFLIHVYCHLFNNNILLLKRSQTFRPH